MYGSTLAGAGVPACDVTRSGKSYLDGYTDSAVGSEIKGRTPLERISSSLEDARNLSMRVNCLVETLIGTRPEAEGNPGKPIGGGLITSMADNAEDAATHIRKAQDELHRLSQVLGLGV